LNVEKARIDRALENNEIKSLITCLGAGISNGNGNGNGKEDAELELVPEGNGNGKPETSMFDTSKLRYDRVIIMTDEDVDGAHIRTLLLTFFYRYMKPLIEEGHLYIAQPPLYRVSSGRNFRYAMNDEEVELAKKELGGRNVMVQRYKGLGEMSANQLHETTLDMNARTLLQVSVEDAVEADEVFTILMGDKVEPRKEFIQKHATEARFIDNI
jgi:DNA gyrase subunit B